MTQPRAATASVPSGGEATAWADWGTSAPPAAEGDAAAAVPPPSWREGAGGGLARSLAAVAAVAVACAPMGICVVAPTRLSWFLLAYQLILESAVVVALGWSLRRGWQPQLALVLVAQLALLAADTTYSTRATLHQYPNGWHHLGENMHTVWLGIACALLWRRLFAANILRLGRAQIVAYAAVILVVCALALIYVVSPLEDRKYRLISRLNYWSYWVVVVATEPAAINLTLTSLDLAEHLWCQGLLLALVCGTAMSYQASLGDYPTVNWGDAGWAMGVGTMALVTLWVLASRTSILPLGQPLSPYRSYRSILGILAFLANASLLATLLAIGALDVSNTMILVATICAMFISWFFANLLALSVSRRLLSFSFATPDLRHVTEAQLAEIPILQPLNAPVAVAEIERLHGGYNRLATTTNWLIGVVVRKHRQAALAALAAQVAHDLGSPTAALNVALDDAAQLPDSTRQVLRSAVHRIQDITMQLVVSYKGASQPGAEPRRTGGEVCLVSSLVAAAVAEKRTQYRDHSGVHIESVVSPAVYGVFVFADPNELIRIICNMVNNSIAALGSHGSVCLEVVNRPKNAQILVVDNGSGVPEHIVARLGDERLSGYLDTHGGLGVPEAHRVLRAYGGRLRYASQVGLGTTAIIELPKVEAPSWFLNSLDLREVDYVVILDDDLSAHRAWRERLAPMRAAGRAVIHVSTGRELASRVEDLAGRRVLFLVDFELSGDDVDGLEVIEQLGIGATTVLVSGMLVLDPAVTGRAARQGLRILMKSLLRLVPIEQPTSEAANL